ncbi:hypothetical protein LXG23DRAFT_18219 [Yarrowia lipolytica]|uniref:Uncharacterized protein n=1 Tax=Yarrowia lipolytica TaxID=4952 RepID=A0A1D8NP91_YARLL|nr:hypothetical protein YALI1_F26737g [Yarrowia lipolytica]KAB8286512.1 hypothetical protein BKA91DRAFT_91491 [Yarrowia lipolytica]KAE8173543.1 hypothetical protein BKA90DRAFT_173266 [Yarrowia lipolytica]KAJ8055471.1 hypothetical protein LXG23DRAFT_18219 [Yarrowia lipolytica]RMJ00259.1 hypothetical protein BD777DRAFT_83605 [Yarrowia lipolytica]
MTTIPELSVYTMQQRYLQPYDDDTLVEEIPPTNAEVGIVPFDDLELVAESQPPCDTWKNCVLSYKMIVQGYDNEILTHEGQLQTNFVPGMSTAICMTSNLNFEPHMTPEDVQRVTLAALVRDRPPPEVDEESDNELCARQSMAIYERYKGRMSELWRDMPELPLFEDGDSKTTPKASSEDDPSTYADGYQNEAGATANDSQNENDGMGYQGVDNSLLPGCDPSSDSHYSDSDRPCTSHSISGGEAVKRTQMLKDRRLWKRANEPQFITCTSCPRKSFKSLAKYAKHLDTHHSGLSNEHLCPSKTCPRSIVGFSTAVGCSQHFNICHRNHDRIFELKCRKWYLKRWRLKPEIPCLSMYVFMVDI